ncbi:MAG: hypothetical protein LBV75_01345 [Paludibacter sp.]|jgi:hypothetical protein|nr:hypothetical protein [Paludibacter sp.]
MIDNIKVYIEALILCAVLMCPIIIVFELLINGVWTYFREKKITISKKKILICVGIFIVAYFLNLYIFKTDEFVGTKLLYFVFGITIGTCVLWGVLSLLFKFIFKIDDAFFMRRILNRKIQSISISNDGFSVTIGSRKNRTEKTEIFLWKDITSAKFKNNSLSFNFFDNKKIQIDNKYQNYYQLLRILPKDIKGINYSSINNFFLRLKSCPVCGFKAVDNDGYCLHCYCEMWNESIKEEFPDQQAYIRENQLEAFATYNQNEKVDFYEKTTGFEKNTDWKPLVTEDEVLEYSKKEVW